MTSIHSRGSNSSAVLAYGISELPSHGLELDPITHDRNGPSRAVMPRPHLRASGVRTLTSNAAPITTEDSAISSPAQAIVNTVVTGSGASAVSVEAVSLDSVSELSNLQTALIYLSLSGPQFISSLSSGLIAVALPRMALDLSLPSSLLLWPTAVYSLVSGCALLPSGAVSDVVGCRSMYLLGILLMSGTLLACGLARTPAQLLVFRALQGLAVSLCLPAGVALMTASFAEGKRRNLGFALQGAAQPVGFSAGLFLAGFFVDSIGWRWGWYIDAMAAVIMLIVGVLCLPKKEEDDLKRIPWRKLKTDVDWVGAGLASLCLGCFSYVLAMIAANGASIRHPANIVLICVAGITAPAFVYWMNYQKAHSRPALIPNDLWRKDAFSAICVMVFIAWGVLNTLEYSFSLYIQQVQSLPALQASIRFIPNILIGVISIPLLSIILHRVSAYWLVLVPSVICAAAPILMAVTNPTWPYWYGSFWAILLSPLGADALLLVATVLTTSLFPSHMQSVAGAVFNTIAQFGQAVGLAVMAVIAANVTDQSIYPSKSSPEALLVGYRASYWACFALSCAGVAVGAWGLRSIGIVGVKRD